MVDKFDVKKLFRLCKYMYFMKDDGKQRTFNIVRKKIVFFGMGRGRETK